MSKLIRKVKVNRSDSCIMAHDPSLTAWGWAVINQHGIIVDSGAIKTESKAKTNRIRKGDDRVRRVREICIALKDTITKYGITYMVSELPHGSQNSNAAIMVGIVAGIIEATSLWGDIGVEWYSENDAKKSICGNAQMGKDDMVKLVAKTYASFPNRGVKWIDQAVADSMAVYHVAVKQSPVLKFMLK